jgi:hypothetical protein
MKKNVKKLRLHRDTLALLDPKAVSPVRGANEAFMTSCTYPCGCPTGCSDEQACLETGPIG